MLRQATTTLIKFNKIISLIRLHSNIHTLSRNATDNCGFVNCRIQTWNRAYPQEYGLIKIYRSLKSVEPPINLSPFAYNY